MSRIDRRTFLRTAAVVGGMAGAQMLGAGSVLAGAPQQPARVPQLPLNFSPLIPTRTENTGEYLLALPAGFKYTVIGVRGSMMSDGRPTPGTHDGMGAFNVNGQLRLVRNHEIGSLVNNPLGNPALAYDTKAGGGTTTLVVNPVTRLLEASWISLSGTIRNCAGGETPWGTWITCEEANVGPRRGYGKIHGYNFEVPAGANSEVQAVPLPAMGLFYHEAVAVDPDTGIVYQTEDLSPSGIYRFIPDTYGDMRSGKLQMLAIDGKPGYDTRSGQQKDVLLPVTWVDIDNPNPVDVFENDILAVYKEGLAKGGATFARGEGMWYGNGSIYFATTNGGNARAGQIFELRVRGPLAGQLRLMYESTDRNVLDAPDNICVSPWGGALMICEDGSGDEFVHMLSRDGNEITRFAQNIVPGQTGSEFAGACFSPDGNTFFVNLQGPGMTFAIWRA